MEQQILCIIIKACPPHVTTTSHASAVVELKVSVTATVVVERFWSTCLLVVKVTSVRRALRHVHLKITLKK
jgi:hypothetical protein